jgi:hypothetical protein
MASASVQPTSPPAPHDHAAPLAFAIPPHLCRIVKWASLGLGGLFVLLASIVTSAATLGGLGIFFAIASRIFQAEEHQGK